MFFSGKLRTVVLFLIIISNVGCDQLSKNVVRESIEYNEQIHLIPDHLLLTKVENTGAFLSLGSTFSPFMKQLFLLGLPIFGLILMLVLLLINHELKQAQAVSLCFIIGGGIGNLIDRVLYGSVTDFLHLDLGLFQTGIFNLADVSITFGILYYLLHYLRQKLIPHSIEPS